MSRLRIVCAAGLIVAVIAVVAGWRRSRWGPVPATRGPFLAGVVEPISIEDSMSWDDGGSTGLRFRDARGVIRDACLMHTLKGNEHLTFGSYVPTNKAEREVPISGPEERAFLGLLERWRGHDPQAQDIEKRYLMREPGEVDGATVLEGSDLNRYSALSVMWTLQSRN